MAVETNARVFPQRDRLYIWVRQAEIAGAHISPEIAEKACLRYVFDRNLPAIVQPGDYTKLLVATRNPIKTITLNSSEWTVTVSDAGKDAYRISLRDEGGEEIVPALLERALICRLQKTDLWTLDSSRIWYKPTSFAAHDDIEAYRRYRIGTLSLGDEGPGIVVDVETAFFTTCNLAYYLDRSVPTDEQERRRNRMDLLMQRQEKQKGTLVYNNGRRIMKCYFAYAPGLKCNETPEIRIADKTYTNLVAYYKEELPWLKFDEEGEAVQVSFDKKGAPVYVAAELLRIRVMSDNVPDALSSEDKILPEPRRQMLLEFWEMLGPRPLGPIAPELRSGFWRPPRERLHQFRLPDLRFGQDAVLKAPSDFSIQAYRENYNARTEYLDEVGCWYVPPNIRRTLYIAFPESFDKEIVLQLASGIEESISSWTKKRIAFAEPIPYSSVRDAVNKLKERTKAGLVVFVLDSTPSAYYEAAFQLDGWRIKRVTERQLQKHYQYLEEGLWDRRQRRKSLQRGQRRWSDFVNFNALDVLQQIGAFPFVPEYIGEYEAQLFIDVGHERREFALNLLIRVPPIFVRRYTLRSAPMAEPSCDLTHTRRRAERCPNQLD